VYEYEALKQTALDTVVSTPKEQETLWMKIEKAELKKIIIEEIESLLLQGGFGSGMKLTPAQIKKRQRQRDEADKNSRRKVSALGGRELVALSRGIVEAGEDEDLNCSDGNPYHNDDGEFTDDKGTGSWSIRTKGSKCNRGQYSKKFKGTDHEECGRDAPVKCKDGAIKEGSQEEKDWMYEYHKLKKQYDVLVRSFTQLKKKKTPKSKGTSMEACLNWVDNVERAAKGTLRDKPKV